MSQVNGPIKIGPSDWTGIGDSPHEGLGLIKNAEIWSYPGAVRGGKKPLTKFHTPLSATFTVNTGTDICTLAGAVPQTGTAVTFTTSNTLPNPLTVNTVYYIIRVSGTDFKLAISIANANAGTPIVDFTTTGTGTQTMTTVDPGTIRHYVNDPRLGRRFCIDSNSRVWYDTGSNIFLLLNNAALVIGGGATATNGVGNGLAIFRVSDGSATYLFAYRNNVIDVINVFGTSNKETPAWTTAWQTMNTTAGTGSSHHSLVGQDNIVYFTDDRYVGSILEKAGSVFDPANAGTYTYNNQALDLPLGSLCYWLEQLGVNLLISVSNDSFIYPWDRVSDSYGLPVPIGEYGGNKMKNMGNIVYVLAGTKGNIYWTQGTYMRPFKTLPQYLTNNTTTPLQSQVTWGGIGAASGRLVVGVGATSGQSGVYMIDPSGAFTLDNYPSTGQAAVTAIYAQDDFYEMGYASGADYMDTSRYLNLECVVQSKMYRVGNHTQKGKFSSLELQIAVPIAATVNFSYRTDLTSSFTPMLNESGGSPTFTTTTSAVGYDLDVGGYLKDLENVQIQVAFDHGLDIMEVRLWP
jgi:hypothetical protein